MKRRRRTMLASLAAASCLVSMCTATAYAAPAQDDTLGHLNSVPVDEPLPVGTAAIAPEELESQAVLDLETSVAVTDIITADTNRAINTVTWDKERDVVHFYVHGSDAAVTALIENEMPDLQAWDVVPAVRPIEEVEDTIEKIAADPAMLPAGLRFVSGTPAPDGASITIGVEGADALLRSSALPDQILGTPVSFVDEARAEPTLRVRNVAPVVSGGFMRGPTSSGSSGCSTGFPVLRYADGQYNMISADHCTDLQGADWTWGSGTHSVGSSTFQAAGDTDLELFVEPDSLSTWVFAGGHQDAATVAPIRGYLAPVGGNLVCYSGSFSGLVCNNVLEDSDTYNCIGFLVCYWTRWSHQIAGTPAAGNGDSGGPVFTLLVRPDDNTVGAYGVGVTSMIPGDSGYTCTGEPGDPDPGGRKCSSNVGFAPLGRWVSAQSTHNLVYTTN